jgi:nitrogen fixation NifU-like protein
MTQGAAQDAELQDLYRELILDHARRPRNFGRLDNPTHAAEGINPLCGDKLKLYLTIGADERVHEICFEGSGCAISVASASLLTETVASLSVAEAEAVIESVTSRLTHGSAVIENEKLNALDGVRKYPLRVKCATLAWHALRAALSNQNTPATTE